MTGQRSVMMAIWIIRAIARPAIACNCPAIALAHLAVDGIGRAVLEPALVFQYGATHTILTTEGWLQGPAAWVPRPGATPAPHGHTNSGTVVTGCAGHSASRSVCAAARVAD